MTKSSKSISEEEFAAQLRAERSKQNVGMIMTKPPTGPNKSLEEVLKDQKYVDELTIKKDEHQRLLRMIDINLIDSNPLAPRTIYTSEMIRERAEALRTQGQHDPIHVIPNPESAGRFIICDGWTRVQACKFYDVSSELLAEIHENLNVEEAAWFGYQQNEERAQHSDLDRAMFYEKIISKGTTAAAVAKNAKVSETQMSFYRSFAKLPPDIIDIIKEKPGKFSATVAYHLNKAVLAVGPRKCTSLAIKFASEEKTQAWLISQVQSLGRANTKKTSSTNLRKIIYKNGLLKQKDEFFELSITVKPDQKEAFAQALEKLLETVGETISY
ncbi:ParB/RepB/Spo0J family partition protein [Zoogloea sp.]|uniref:ParB/RepB/Spo0J family partition protein n=1 Tax=Zoogloea sp. TaxID=49181 RepID=UPI00260BD718|nr:ParB/RepB/Spo0J family partition protein [Zoogloea sp.]MDD3353258.1 ParB/RepB/Spo0J family partition protein [Zoogloea sp.]